MSFQEEFFEQVWIVNFLRSDYPDVLFTASAGGMRTSVGTGKKMKAMGYSRGTPDLWIIEPRKGFSSLVIELKKEKGGVLSKEQKEWLKKLNERGFLAICCRGREEAEKAIKEYFR